MENLETIKNVKKTKVKTRHYQVRFKNLGVLFFINFKLTLKLKSVIATGVIYLILATFFVALEAMTSFKNSGMFKIVNFICTGFMFFVFCTMICAYLFKSQLNEGVHNIELRAGVPPIQTFFLRIFVAILVVYVYVGIHAVIAGIAAPFAGQHDKYMYNILTPTLFYFFLGFFFVVISASWCVFAKLAVGIVLSIMTSLILLLAPIGSSMGISFNEMQKEDKQDAKMQLTAKMQLVGKVNITLKYSQDFINAVNDAKFSNSLIQNEDNFLANTKNQQSSITDTSTDYYKNHDEFVWVIGGTSGVASSDSNHSSWESDQGSDGTYFDYLMNYGRPYYETLTGGDGKIVGESDTNGLGELISTLTKIAEVDANTEISKNQFGLDEGSYTPNYRSKAEKEFYFANDISFFTGKDSSSSYNDFTSRNGDIKTFVQHFTKVIKNYAATNANNPFLQNQGKNLINLVNGLKNLIQNYGTSIETMGANKISTDFVSSNNLTLAPRQTDIKKRIASSPPTTNIKLDGIGTIADDEKNGNKNLTLNAYYNFHQEFCALIAALITGYEQIRCPMLSINYNVDTLKKEDSSRNVKLTEVIPAYNQFVKQIVKNAGGNIELHIGMMGMGYTNNPLMETAAAGYSNMLLYNFVSHKYSLNQDDFINLSDNEKNAVLGKKVQLKTKSIWSYGGMVTAYVVFGLIIGYCGSLIHKRKSKI